MLLSWIQYQFAFIAKFLANTVQVTTTPAKFAREQIHFGDRTSFFRAMNFWVFGLGFQILFASFVSLFLMSFSDAGSMNVIISDAISYLWELLFCVVGYASLRLMAGKVSFQNFTHCYLYVASASNTIGNLMVLPFMAQFSLYPMRLEDVELSADRPITGSMVTEFCNLPNTMECQIILRLESGSLIAYLFSFGGVVVISVVFGFVLGKILHNKSDIGVWKGVVAFSAVGLAGLLIPGLMLTGTVAGHVFGFW